MEQLVYFYLAESWETVMPNGGDEPIPPWRWYFVPYIGATGLISRL
jgi:hypothetical protein